MALTLNPDSKAALLNEGPFAYPFESGGLFCSGMTLRDYFAARALQALITGRTWGHINKGELFETWASSSYGLADAMLAARNASDPREQLVAALTEMLDQHENGIVGVSQACADRARAALVAAGVA